ncbi:ABC transporter permease [Methanospirillum hungatei]|uniref:ABC transporter permease n=1 Tax=Methanospirillum hungatei TaxID=2203 RepID=UPI0026F01608|nr:ABC transporter permease [Methanospirillum hungatei]MCA1916893.1 ABC transporter permease [Methanospirillum hungatei]
MKSGSSSSFRGSKGLIILIFGLIVFITILFYTLPLLSLFLRITPEEFINTIYEPNVQSAILLSLVTATTATAIIVILGTPLAFLNARVDYSGRKFVETLIDIPIVLPPSVAGLSLLVLLGRRGLLGSTLSEMGITIIFTTLAVIIAQVFVAGPLYIRQAKSAFAMVDPVFESASRTLGAGPIITFIKVTAPLARTGLISGIIISFARAIGEFGATIMVAGNLPGKTQTMPLAIYGFMQSNLTASIALSIVLIAISFVILVLIRILSGKSA